MVKQMDKYIKYEDIQECRFFQDERGEWILHADIIKLPAADVVPVRHGRWVELEDGDCKCSLCGCYHHTWEAHGYYCQHCGALMDKDGDGE